MNSDKQKNNSDLSLQAGSPAASDGLTKSHTSYTVTIICDRSKSVAIRPKCGFLRITGLYRINNKTCGLLDLQDSLESSESTAKLGVNTLIKIIYNMHIHLV